MQSFQGLEHDHISSSYHPLNDEPFPICSPSATEEDQRPGSFCFLQGEFCER